jgi:hypothetical protein
VRDAFDIDVLDEDKEPTQHMDVDLSSRDADRLPCLEKSSSSIIGIRASEGYNLGLRRELERRRIILNDYELRVT